MLNPANPMNYYNPVSPWYHVYHSGETTEKGQASVSTGQKVIVTCNHIPIDPASFLAWLVVLSILIGGVVWYVSRED